MVASEIKLDLDNIVKRQREEQAQKDYEAKTAPPKPEEPLVEKEEKGLFGKFGKTKKDPEPVQQEEPEEVEGVYQHKKMIAPDRDAPNALNEAMALEAAHAFKKKEKNIQAACAKLDKPSQSKQGCACIIL